MHTAMFMAVKSKKDPKPLSAGERFNAARVKAAEEIGKGLDNAERNRSSDSERRRKKGIPGIISDSLRRF